MENYHYTYGFYASPSEKYKNITLNIVKNDSKKFERMIYDLRKFEDLDVLITDYEEPLIIQLLSGIRVRKFPQGAINDETVKLINDTGEKGMVLLTDDLFKGHIYSYYKSNQYMLHENKHFKTKYEALLFSLPLSVMY